MRPRLKIYDGIWFCRDASCKSIFGIGDTPEAAYASWIRTLYIHQGP